MKVRFCTQTPKAAVGIDNLVARIESAIRTNGGVDLRAHKASGETTFSLRDEESFERIYMALERIHPDLKVYSYKNAREIIRTTN